MAGLLVAAIGCLVAACASKEEGASAQAPISVVSLRTEHAKNPLGIDARVPRFSWQIRASSRGVMQSAYQIRVAASEKGLISGKALIWDSGKVASGESILRPYGGPALESTRRYYWAVRVWDANGVASEWSPPAYWEMGLLEPSDWQAEWIEPAFDEDPSRANPAPMLRRSFRLNGNVRSARAYITSRGLYEMYLNGQRVGDQLFTPGWTSYNKRLQYQVYDVTDQLTSGDNAVGVVLGDGWFRGVVGFYDLANHYGERLALLMQIRVVYDDGREELIVTDSGWKSSTGPIRMSQIYAGETYDARLEKGGWSTSEYDDSGWFPVRVVSHGKDILAASAGVPVRRIEERVPIRIFKTPAGDVVADMGQNMVGWVRLKVEGPAGTTVRLRHAEVLDKDGNFYTRNLLTARQEDRYTLKGSGLEVFEPHFTFHGFRYVAVDGYPGELTPDRLTGIVIHSDLPVAGRFETSSRLINQLQSNIVWSQKGNFFDVPLDCPQRNERLGWTGDAQIFFPTAAFNMNVARFFGKWLADLAADQGVDGRVPFVIPDVIPEFQGQRPPNGVAGWGDAATVIPWGMYVQYGDVRVLETQYESMKAWVGYQQARAGDDLIWDGDFQFGDWMDFGSEERDSFGATDTALIATAYFAHSADLVSRAAEVLGRHDDARRYRELRSRIVTAFRDKFVKSDGQVGAGTQTAYVLALEFDLLPQELRAPAAKRLAQSVRETGHLTTGFLGTPRLLHALSRNGYLEEAYRLLNRTDYPSWLYPVQQGATTIWERWNAINPDGSFGHATVNSFNHFAYGAVGEWMYRVIVGIHPDESAPGYKHIVVQPQPGGELTHASASHETPYGTVRTAWSLREGSMKMNVEIPPNTRATVRLPGAVLADVTESGMPLARSAGIDHPRQDDGAALLEMGSGTYQFAWPYRGAEGQSMRPGTPDE